MNTLEQDLDLIERQALVGQNSIIAIAFFKDAERRRALSNQDSIRYVELCQELGVIVPEDHFLYQTGLVELAQRSSVQRDVRNGFNGFRLEANEDNGRKKPAIDYVKFLSLANSYGINEQNAFQHPSSVRQILVKSGYKQAYVGKGRKVPLSQASDSRVSAMYITTLASARKWQRSQSGQQ